MTGDRPKPLVPPDCRYIVVRGRLWRRANPNLGEDERQSLVATLVAARRAGAAARRAGNVSAEADAHTAVDVAKHGLGERGAVWWEDGAPDRNRHMARNTHDAARFAKHGG